MSKKETESKWHRMNITMVRPAKLERPVPHAEATKKALDKLREMTPEQARETFIETGILTSDGRLAESYGGKRASTPAIKMDVSEDVECWK